MALCAPVIPTGSRVERSDFAPDCRARHSIKKDPTLFLHLETYLYSCQARYILNICVTSDGHLFIYTRPFFWLTREWPARWEKASFDMDVGTRFDVIRFVGRRVHTYGSLVVSRLALTVMESWVGHGVTAYSNSSESQTACRGQYKARAAGKAAESPFKCT